MSDSGWYGWQDWKMAYWVDVATGCVISCLRRWRSSKDQRKWNEPGHLQWERRWAVPEIHRRDGPCKSSLVEIVSDAVHGLTLKGHSRIPIEIQNLHRAFWSERLKAEDYHGKAFQRCRLCRKPPHLHKGRFAGLGTDTICARCMGLKPEVFKAKLYAAKASGRLDGGNKNARTQAIGEDL